jgi:hypothetical protein
MNDWSVDNFLERLMPRLQGRHNGVQHSCPDEESLCAYAEDRAGGVVRDGIAAHLKECESCAGLCQRLLEFARPSTAVPEDEWANAEKRLGNWMDGFLLAESRRAKVAVEPVAVYSAPGVGWFSAWKLQWALGAIAAVVISGATYFIFFGSFGGYLQTAMHRPAATAPIDAQSRPEAPSQVPIQPEPITAPPQTMHLSTQNLPSSAETTRSSPPAPASVQPAPPAAPNQYAPIAPPASIQVYTAQNPPAPSWNERPGNHGAQEAPPPQEAQPAAPVVGGYQNAAVITPEIKAAVADEVKLELASYQAYAANPHPQETANGNQMPGALDPKLRTFIVSAVLTEQTTDGTQCSLSPGDILTRIMDTPDTNVRVTALVTSSQRNDCATGSLLAISVWELQNMHNDFAQKIDAGLQKLADNEGKNGMPAGPMAGRRTNPDGQAQPDINASADLQQQLQDADNAEKDVSQAAAGITPSSFHQSPRRPANSDIFSRFDDDSLRISRSTKPKSDALTLIAWRPDSQQTNPHPQQAAPAKPAPAEPAPTPKKPTPPPPPAPKPAPAQPSHPPAPANAMPPATQHPASSTQQRPDAKLPVTGGRAPASRADQLPKTAARPDSTGSPGGGSREMRANGSSVYRDRTGRVTSVMTRSGAVAKFDPNGHLSSINFSSTRGYGVTVNHGAHGTRTVVSERVNERGERIKVVNTGLRRGYVDRTFFRNNRPFMTRTYVVNGRSYAAVYNGFYYSGRVYFGYVPGYYYAPGFYGWAYSPWGAPLAFAWGWGAAPWYGEYGYYFAPYPAYAGPAFWLTDYVIAESLQAAFEAQADATSSAIPRKFAPKLGAKSENEFTAVVIPAISDALKSDPVPKQRFA